jgi:hypothetical protein
MPEKLPLCIGRRMLISYVCRKLQYKIESIHVACIAGILFDEIMKDMFDSKEIKIYNFGVLRIYQLADQMGHDVVRRARVVKKGVKVLRLILDESIKNIVDVHLDVERTLEARYNDKTQ